MMWQNLKRNKCPKCGKNLQWEPEHPQDVNGKPFFWCDCGFSISEKKFKEIVIDQVNDQFDKEETIRQEERDSWFNE